MIYGSAGSTCSHVDWTDYSDHPRHRLCPAGGHLRLYLFHQDQTESPPTTQGSRDRTATARRRWRRKQSWRRRRRRWRRAATGNIHAPISLPEVILPQPASRVQASRVLDRKWSPTIRELILKPLCCPLDFEPPPSVFKLFCWVWYWIQYSIRYIGKSRKCTKTFICC